jgi:hypothetical protein
MPKQKRHKCSICHRTRFESKMETIKTRWGGIEKSRYGNECWACVDNPDCKHKAEYFRSY